MIRWLDFLLVLYLVYQSGILPVGNDHITETGEKGGNVTLTCEFKDHNISQFELLDQTGDIVCENEECTSKFVKKGACDVIIKDLSFSDAGKYTLTVYYDDDQREVEPEIRKYHLHIHGNISVKIGKPLKLDVLLANAVKVETNSSGEWTEVWKKGRGVWSERLNESHGNLIIKAFMDTDAGTYRVLDSEGEIWVTVTVTESSPESGSKGGQRNTKNDTEQQSVIAAVGLFVLVLVVWILVTARTKINSNLSISSTEPNLNSTDDHGTNGTVKNWSLIVGVSVGFGVLVVGAAVALIIYCVRHQMRRQHQQGNMPHNYEMAPVQDPVHN